MAATRGGQNGRGGKTRSLLSPHNDSTTRGNTQGLGIACASTYIAYHTCFSSVKRSKRAPVRRERRRRRHTRAHAASHRKENAAAAWGVPPKPHTTILALDALSLSHIPRWPSRSARARRPRAAAACSDRCVLEADVFVLNSWLSLSLSFPPALALSERPFPRTNTAAWVWPQRRAWLATGGTSKRTGRVRGRKHPEGTGLAPGAVALQPSIQLSHTPTIVL